LGAFLREFFVDSSPLYKGDYFNLAAETIRRLEKFHEFPQTIIVEVEVKQLWRYVTRDRNMLSDWLIYAGPNGWPAHISALREIASEFPDSTIYVPGNRGQKVCSSAAELNEIIGLYESFSKLSQKLASDGLSAIRYRRSSRHQISIARTRTLRRVRNLYRSPCGRHKLKL